jgi:hypothetical protein
MSEMIERVARSMAGDIEEGFPRRVQQSWDDLTTLAKAAMRQRARIAIEAMREPTEAMAAAGDLPGWDDITTIGHSLEVWHAMIETALTPSPKGDYPGLDRHSKSFSRWWRQVGALIGLVSVFMIAPLTGANQAWAIDLVRGFPELLAGIAMAENGVPSVVAKAVEVGSDTRNVNKTVIFGDLLNVRRRVIDRDSWLDGSNVAFRLFSKHSVIVPNSGLVSGTPEQPSSECQNQSEKGDCIFGHVVPNGYENVGKIGYLLVLFAACFIVGKVVGR